ncbi:MAG: TetR/AcrR family transcriptional regulator [Spirochaetales bacterium]|uniref:TetR/AcrR family transcriptional regulator n=1 Tax=Candidatus Thalassospirochaeta sargassi TaxID=3119039 RepID=A0AAJ1IC91_9SPIO|nr:TetR/AcrR family transcriptional regulator [Spirochaetales bacterium]
MGKMKNADSAKTREKIISTAAFLITKQGAENTSLSDIARESGISKGTLYYYYPTKSELLFEITSRHMKRLSEDILHWVSNMSADLPPEKILQAVYSLLTRASKRGRLHLYLIYDGISGDEASATRVRTIYQEWKNTVKEGIGQLTSGNPDKDILAELILACLDGVFIQASLGIKDIPIEKMTRHILR